MKLVTRSGAATWLAGSVGLLAVGGAAPAPAATLDPCITAWRINTTGAKGNSPDPTFNSHINTIPADVQSVYYDSNYAYIKATDIPSYPIGPYNGNPSIPTQQNKVIRITRTPQVQSGTKTATNLGAIGSLVNGVDLFNPLDANSYQNANVWHQNAPVVEGPGFDAALGHSGGGGSNYHHHEYSPSLSAQLHDDGSKHSPIIGFAFDGFPIYGPFGYANSNGTGGVVRMGSSYALRNITQRHTLPDGTQLQPSQYGPDVSSQYPLGFYVEDFAYTAGSSPLDQYNGRFSVTPDYPNGIYAYFASTDNNGKDEYPYFMGPSYNGVVDTADLHTPVTIPANVTQYGGSTTTSSTWQARAVAVGPDNLMRVLWNNTDGRAALWVVDNSGNMIVNNTYGPYPNWSASRIAVGGDGKLQVLWNNTDGTAALWRLSPGNQSSGGGALEANSTIGPYSGWIARDLATAADNKPRVMWVRGDGTLSLWQIAANGSLEVNNSYGPFSAWHPISLAVGTEGKMRVLWGNDNGQASFWLVGSGSQTSGGGAIESNVTYGPYSTWKARRVGVGADNKLRALWVNTDGTASLWVIAGDASLEVNNTYGPYSGWQANDLAVGADNKARLLWGNQDGRAALWQVAPGSQTKGGGGLEVNLTFGPY